MGISRDIYKDILGHFKAYGVQELIWVAQARFPLQGFRLHMAYMG